MMIGDGLLGSDSAGVAEFGVADVFGLVVAGGFAAGHEKVFAG